MPTPLRRARTVFRATHPPLSARTRENIYSGIAITVSADFHEGNAEAVKPCVQDSPNYDRAYVAVFCPEKG